jgi:ferredoxin--NADP+ reductase/benzoate/toluate 1,2-dioxygenase reductase subunit
MSGAIPTAARKSRVHHVRELSKHTYVLRMERGDLEFEPGQYISVGPKNDLNMREYSVYSSPKESYLEILVREVQEGYVSKLLRQQRDGDSVLLEGPFGFFLLDEETRQRPLYFIATGTGISPFHSFQKSYENLDYTLLHGIRNSQEQYDYGAYERERIVACTSREESGDYHGRVTEYLREHPVDPEAACFLCGNCDMIYEAFDILQEQGIPHDRLFAEVYF